MFMKKICLAILMLAAVVILPVAVRAQGGAKQVPQVVRDADLEKDSLHNLEVARHYFKLRKAYVAALQRAEEIVAGNPTFSRIDEVLLIAGQSSLNLAEGKGKQRPTLYVVHEGEAKRTLKPEEFRELARDYFSQLVNSYPDSAFRAQADVELRALGGAKPKQ
jgi:outer membrane protein assembly factor BamD (BamD/ComL family)